MPKDAKIAFVVTFPLDNIRATTAFAKANNVSASQVFAAVLKAYTTPHAIHQLQQDLAFRERCRDNETHERTAPNG